MGISFWQIAIVVVLVVLLFGRGKISSLMGDVAKGIKSFKKGMSDDTSSNNQTTILSQIILTLKINSKNASNWMVRDFINSNHCNISLRPKRISNSFKKIGTYIGKFKNTLSNFQKEVSLATKDINLDEDIVSKKKNRKRYR